jgi:hypothetical protein
MTRAAGTVLGMLIVANAATAQFVQQGTKLVGAGAVGPAMQGKSVAVSADGTTALVGGSQDDASAGATWVFARSRGGTWSQQGGKLVGRDAVGTASQGWSAAISADGNTAIVGGNDDNDGVGAAWVFTRSGGVWSQQGGKLVGADAVGAAWQGNAVAISADGNTAIVGGYFDDTWTGAAWVYARNGGVWSQQGGKLVGTDAIGAAEQGASVAISADGNTAVVGGFNDGSGVGAAWVYTRSGGVWLQQGGKLVGKGAIGSSAQGCSVAISADGNTAIVGGYGDSSGVGAAWVYARSGGVWSQQGGKLVGTGAADPNNHILQGVSVAISADGNTAIVGGQHDEGYVGAVWVFARSGGVWSQRGSKLVGTGAVGTAWQGSSVAISADGGTAIVGGDHDGSSVGAVWVFASSACSAPSIYAQPQSQSVQAGEAVTLSVSATGTAPLSFQWYQGEVGDTSTPVGEDASTYMPPPLMSPVGFWVRVANACGTADSTTAVITIGRRVRRHLQRSR